MDVGSNPIQRGLETLMVATIQVREVTCRVTMQAAPTSPFVMSKTKLLF